MKARIQEIECRTCGNIQRVEAEGEPGYVEFYPCGLCGTPLCERCDRVECLVCGKFFCREHIHAAPISTEDICAKCLVMTPCEWELYR